MRPERWGDLALVALLVGLSLTGLPSVPADAPGMAVAVVAVAVLQVPPVLLRRTRPRVALLLHAPLLVASAALALPSGSVALPVLAFALLRRGRPALRFLTAVTLAPSAAAGAVWAALGGHPPVSGLAFAVLLALVLGTQAAAGAALGAASRSAQQRAEDARAAAELARLDAAVAAERARIADEIGGGVLVGLRRLVTAASDADALARGAPGAARALQVQAREVLDGLSRVLVALRTPSAADDPAPPPRRRALPLPTTGGLVLVAVFAVTVVVTDLLPDETGDPTVDLLVLRWADVPLQQPLTVPLLAVQLLPLAWWRTAPVAALAVTTLGSTGSWFAGSTHLVAETGWSVLVHAAARTAPPLVSGPAVLLCSTVVLGYLAMAPGPAGTGLSTAQIAGPFALVPVLWTVGVLQRAVRLRTEREAAARAGGRLRGQVEAERVWTARELHDLVAHHVSALAVQAAAARSAGDPQSVRTAAGHVADLARRIEETLPALTAATRAPVPPALTVDDVERLVAPVRTAGVPVTVTVSGTPSPVPGDAEVFAQRILTEALTNVVRHAGASPTAVAVEHRAGEVVVEVRDAGPVDGHRAAAAGSGLGLLGMRERAELLGGELVVRSGPDGFGVRARLPRAARLLPEEERTVAGDRPRG
nr:two-component sensor histidine kinase [uncultured bacterium]